VFSILFLIPALKNPGNPPAVGNPETIVYRQSLYIGMLTISGFSALGLALVSRAINRKKSKKVIIPLIYAGIISIGFIILPANPDDITISMELVMNFRVVSTLTMGVFWAILGLVLGSFWDKTNPHESANIVTI